MSSGFKIGSDDWDTNCHGFNKGIWKSLMSRSIDNIITYCQVFEYIPLFPEKYDMVFESVSFDLILKRLKCRAISDNEVYKVFFSLLKESLENMENKRVVLGSDGIISDESGNSYKNLLSCNLIFQ
jgi:hypothetical protein